ncbi:MAG: methyltransferase domain-containing protein [Isosphaeraceae bacterium]
MRYLLFPGRHLANTRFQEEYLLRILRLPADRLDFYGGDATPVAGGSLDTIVFAISSANRENSRYNCVPFHVRAVGVDRFARGVASALGVSYRIFGIPHYPPSDRFARNVIREVAEQTEGALPLDPGNAAVLCSTPEVIAQFRALGFSILPAELGEPAGRVPPTPIDLVRRLAALGDSWSTDPGMRKELSPATFSLWTDFPDVPRRIARLFRDPLLTEQGDLTATRNYATYSIGMSRSDLIEMKYRDIRPSIAEGRIVDEGCADGGLLVPIARDFPDSDLIGIEITGEFLAQCHERQRRGDFGETYVHFHQRNLMEDLFDPGSIDTTLCNSTTHEIWSYGDRADSLVPYLERKFRQTRPGGRIAIRDVVGPEDKGREVFLRCNDADGSNEDIFREFRSDTDLADHLRGLSTAARFRRFARDFLADDRAKGRRGPETAIAYDEAEVDGRRYFVLRLKDAAEFLGRKDYLDNWRSELHEEFAFWSPTEWKQALSSAGFELVVTPAEPSNGTRAYLNPWIVENRYRGKVELFSRSGNGPMEPLEYPPTNIVLVGVHP